MSADKHKKLDRTIFHVATESDWNECMESAHYIPAAFSGEGFIHCCEIHQLVGVMQRYFQGKNGLLLLHIDINKLRAPLKYEGFGELFPHLYGPLNKDALIGMETLERV